MTLPEGRTGQALAVLVSLLVLAVLWVGIAAPVVGWYANRADQLAVEQAEIAHGEALRLSLPALRAAATAAAAQADANDLLFTGGSDAIAGANLQSALQGLAAQAGTGLDSIAEIPAQQDGALRRIGVQVTVTATWPVLVALLQAIDTARPRMIVGQLTVTSPGVSNPQQDVQLQAGFSVAAYRTGPP